MGETVIKIFGLVSQNKAESRLVEAQSAAIAQQSERQMTEINRQAQFKQAQLEEDRRVQRINADLQEIDRQRTLGNVLSSQKALAAGRFDVSTSRSFLALTEATERAGERDIEVIRLGAGLAEGRSFLEQEEIESAAKAGVITSREEAISSIDVLRKSAKARKTARTISTVGSIFSSAKSALPSPGR